MSGNGDTVVSRLTASGHAIHRTPTSLETGAGDMTATAFRNIIWRARANNHYFPPTMPCLKLMKSFLVMVASVILLNLTVTLVLGWATKYSLTKNSLRCDVKEAINRGYIAVQYIQTLNEGLQMWRDRRSPELKSKITKLNEAYALLYDKIREVIISEESEEQSDNYL